MSRTTCIIVGDHVSDFILAQLASGRFASASEVVRAGLRLLEEHEAKLHALRNALIAGEESGEPKAFDSASFLRRMHKTHAR
jgi:antitoxin ParD1/3/4